MSKVFEYHARQLKRAKENMERDTADHEFVKLNTGTEDIRVYECGRPDSSIFRFTIVCTKGRLVVFGDMGTCIWERQEPMEPWFRGSVGSLDYLSEKVPRGCLVKEPDSELIPLWIEDAKADLIESGFGKDSERYQALDEVVDCYYDDVKIFQLRVYESNYFDGDCDSLPDLNSYTYRYLWLVYAIEKCLNQFVPSEVGDETAS